MRLIHDVEYNLTIALIVIGERGPERSKRRVRRTALSDNLAIESGIGVHIDDAISSRVQAGRYNLIELGKIGGVQGARGRSTSQICPANSQSESVETFLHEVPHLPRTILAAVFGQRWPDHG